jgi:hypothetical protein
MTYTFDELDNITIKHKGCSIDIYYSPHPSIQRWRLLYCGVESIGIDPSLDKIVEIIFSEQGVQMCLTPEQKSKLINYIDEFINRNKIIGGF